MSPTVEIVLWVSLGLLMGGLCALWLARAWRRMVNRRRFQRGRRGEDQATALLERAGYAIETEQPEQACTMLVDGRELPYTVRADFRVCRDGRPFVVEVKTGSKAPDPLNSATRRQLLEYSLAYDAELLLVDMEAERIHRIAFPVGRPVTRPRRPVALLVLFGLLGALTGWALHAWLC